MSSETLVNSVGLDEVAGAVVRRPLPPATASAPSSRPLSMYDITRSYCSCDTTGPNCVVLSSPGPTLAPFAASASADTTSSYWSLWTKSREPALQAWPVLK